MLIGFKNRFQENNLYGAIIAGRTGSNWVHTELIYEDGISVSSWAKTGVALRPTQLTIKKPQYWEVYNLGNIDTTRLDQFLRAQVGAKYDWRSIFFAYGIPLQMQSNNKWVCSELVHYGLAHYTTVPIPATSTVTPGQLRSMIIEAGYSRIL